MQIACVRNSPIDRAQNPKVISPLKREDEHQTTLFVILPLNHINPLTRSSSARQEIKHEQK